ncbi:MAG TPA: hypothetical protein PKI21_04475 [Nitrospira sp.]|nr:hypothetical protein [Nitrospira sp.]
MSVNDGGRNTRVADCLGHEPALRCGSAAERLANGIPLQAFKVLFFVDQLLPQVLDLYFQSIQRF